MADQPQSWHRTPEAQAILASIMANPPRVDRNRSFDPHNRGMRETPRYVGRRVAQLHELKENAGYAAMATGDMDIFGAHLDTPLVDILIYTAIHGRIAALGIFGLAADEADIPVLERAV